MIVADATAVTNLLRADAGSEEVAGVLLSDEPVLAPHLLDLEVTQVLRRWNRLGELDDERADQALRDLLDLPIARQPHDLLLDRVWALRHNLTAYDAAYLALAELVGARLVTLDRRLAAVAAKTVEVIVPSGTG